LTKQRSAPSPTSKVRPPASFTHTGTAGRPPETAATAGGTVTLPGNGRPLQKTGRSPGSVIAQTFDLAAPPGEEVNEALAQLAAEGLTG
jgi:hypothetical protein